MGERHPIPDTALALHSAFLGMTGSGKTSTAKLAVEQVVAAGARVCVLDPIKSDWWGITSSADGKAPGLPFLILGGPHGHLPLSEEAGERVAEMVADGTLPLSVLDMADFGAGGHAGFFVAFARTLLRRVTGVVYLVIEEAHLFAPKERSGIGAETNAIHWAKTLATAGRSKGIRLIVATQRVQSLHNALLGSCQALFAHRTQLPADRKPIAEWLRGNLEKGPATEIEASLPGLPTGTGWMCVPLAGLRERVAFPRIATFDNTATPEIGSRRHAPVAQAPVDVEAIRAALAAVVGEQAPAKPTGRGRTPTDAAGLAAADRAGYERGLAEGLRRGRAETAAALAEIEAGASDLLAAILHRRGATEEAQDRIEKARVVEDARGAPRSAPQHRQSPPARAVKAAAEIGVERRSLAVLASVYPAGMTEAQWAAAARMKRSGGAWGGHKSRLRGAGRIEERSGLWYATEDGLLALGNELLPMPPAGPELVAFWITRLPGVGPMLRHLAEIWPASISRDELAEALGMVASGGGFGGHLKRLRDAELIIEPSRGMIRAADALMSSPGSES